MRTPLLELPFELHLLIFDLLNVRDIIAVLSTCHAFRRDARNERIFAHLCARYDVRNVSRFAPPYNSYYAVFTRLLHIYGPLMGLWASDGLQKFGGRMLQIRFHPGAEPGTHGPPPCIVGEEWVFPRKTMEPTKLQTSWTGDCISSEDALYNVWDGPDYDPALVRPYVPRAIFHIGFFGPGLSVSELGDLPSRPRVPTRALRYATVLCCRDGLDCEQHDGLLTLSPPGQMDRSMRLQVRPQELDIPLPDFPPANAPWVDGTKLHARGILISSGWPPWVDKPKLQEELLATDVPIRVVEEPRSPPAVSHRYITLQCPCFRQSTALLTGPERFFPVHCGSNPHRKILRLAQPLARRKDSVELDALTGVWYGGVKGVEPDVVYVYVDRLSWRGGLPTLRAYKLTGEVTMPRGPRVWKIHPHLSVEPSTVAEDIQQALRVDSSGSSSDHSEVYAGKITLSNSLYITSKKLATYFALPIATSTGPPIIRIWWRDMEGEGGAPATFMRYQPPTPNASVQDLHTISLQPGWRMADRDWAMSSYETNLRKMQATADGEDEEEEEIDYTHVAAHDANAEVVDTDAEKAVWAAKQAEAAKQVEGVRLQQEAKRQMDACEQNERIEPRMPGAFPMDDGETDDTRCICM